MTAPGTLLIPEAVTSDLNATATSLEAATSSDTTEMTGTPSSGGVRRLLSAVLIVLLAGLLALTAAVTVVPRLMGGAALTVLTGSMEPTLSVGDVAVVTPVAPEEIRPGDVITFQPISGDPTLVTHRVVGITLGAEGAVVGFTTQGDTNNSPDDPIVVDQVMGRVAYSVPWIGHLTHASWGPQVIVVLAVGLIAFGGVSVVTAARTTERKES